MIGPLNRRALLGSIATVGAVAAVPVLAHSRAHARQERIKLHADALAALVREELPPGADRITISINHEFAGGASHVGVFATKRVWETDRRLQGGGLWVDRAVGNWWPRHGFLAYGEAL